METPNETVDRIAQMSAQLEQLAIEAIASEEAYRNARGNAYIAMACPTDGSKKPADELIKARLDVDPNLSALRHKMDTDAAILSAKQYAYKATVAMIAAKA